MRTVGKLFYDTFLGWQERKAPLYAAALAYSTLFSLAPLLILAIFFASLTVNEAVVEARLLETIQNQVGPDVAALTEQILAARLPMRPSGLATFISAGLLLFAASNVFAQLRGAINAMWQIEVRVSTVKRTLLNTVKTYLVSLAAALLIGMAPILFLFASTIVASVPKDVLERVYRSGWLDLIVRVFSSPVAYFVFFALVFKLLPQARAPWRAIWTGALLAAVLYWFGGAVLSWYVQNNALKSLYGAAGSAIALLLWAYYSAWILLYGAKFIHVYAARRGYAIVPHADTGFVEIIFRARE